MILSTFAGKAAQTFEYVVNFPHDTIPAALNDNIPNPEGENNPYPKGSYDAKTGKYTSGVVTDRHAIRYADDLSEGYGGVALAFVAGPENVDYAVSMGEMVEDEFKGSGIPFKYFITVMGKDGFAVVAYGNGRPSATVRFEHKDKTIADMEARIYSLVKIKALKYSEHHKSLKH
jgi:hypothetical protein